MTYALKRLLFALAVLCLASLPSGATITSPDDLDTNYFENGQVGAITAARIRTLNNSIAGLYTTQQSGTSYTFTLADRGTMVESTSASSTTFLVPTNATAAFDIGTVISFRQYGAGVLSIAGVDGTVTIRTPSSLILRTQYASGSIQKRGTNEWVVSGDMQ